MPLKWKGVPADTKELAIYIARFKHENVGGTRSLVIQYADLLSHIDPSRRKLAANELPDEAGWSKIGLYSCPPSSKGQRVLVEVLALDRTQPQRLMKRRLATRLIEEALTEPRPLESRRSPGKLTSDAAAIGRLITTYPGPHNE